MLYFFITYSVLVITFYASFLIDRYKIDSSFSGFMISAFFLAIMLPGFFVNGIIRLLKSNVNVVSLAAIAAGLAMIGIFRSPYMLLAGSVLAGLDMALCSR